MTLADAYRIAQATARELVTLELLAVGEPTGPEVDRRLQELSKIPHATTALVELLVAAVAAQWENVDEYSAYILASLASDDTQSEDGQ